MAKSLVQSPHDNVATMLEAVSKGEIIDVQVSDNKISITVKDDIPFGHKVAIKEINKGVNVYKYGQVIGRSIDAIQVGDHVHIHNIESLRARGDLQGGKV